jgi:hypothetical protein
MRSGRILALVSIVLIIFSSISFAQKDFSNSIKGKVIDSKTNKPIAGAVFYLTRTGYYAIADNNGNYEIKNIIPGSYQPVVSAKNYVPKMSTMYVDKANNYTINGNLQPLPADIISGFNEPKKSDFNSDYMKFERIIIGQTPYMGSCKVENPEAMNFKWNGDVIEGSSNGPIIFVNTKFGYKLHCIINSFWYDTKQSTRGLDYTLYFEEMKAKDDDEQEDWQDYRKEAYIGSLYHFLWALRNEKLVDEDYEIFIMRSIGSEAMMSDGTEAASDASSQFQNKVLSFSEISLGVVDENQIMFSINGYMKVVHKPRSYNREVSFLQVPSQATMTLDKEGWTDIDMPFTCYGLWGRNGISNLLPKEYRAKQ